MGSELLKLGVLAKYYFPHKSLSHETLTEAKVLQEIELEQQKIAINHALAELLDAQNARS